MRSFGDNHVLLRLQGTWALQHFEFSGCSFFTRRQEKQLA